MRKVLVTASVLAAWSGAASADPQEGKHPGCKGVEHALTEANAKGRGALLDVAGELGCLEPDPEPSGSLACPDGAAAIATYAWAGYFEPTPDEYGYGTWVGAFSLVEGGGVSIPFGDAGGFYWTAEPGVTVTHIVLKGELDEYVTIEAQDPVSQNHLTVRNGMWMVRFCG